MVDKKAFKILMDTFWDSKGWKKPDIMKPEDLDYAIEAGLMFRPWRIGHKDIVNAARRSVAELSLVDVSNAFLSSLSSRRLELRSALGSYACGLNFPDHAYVGTVGCQVCGLYGNDSEERDLNVLNFERYKWGGVRHLNPLYIAFDLGQFISLSKPEPIGEDFQIMNAIIEKIDALPLDARSSHLEKALASIIYSNRNERRILIQILGYCGILETKEIPGPATKFINSIDRPFPPTTVNDWSYSISWWTRANGINRTALKKFFPQDSIRDVNG